MNKLSLALENWKTKGKLDMNKDLAQATKDYFIYCFDNQQFDGVNWTTEGKDYHELVKSGTLENDVHNSIINYNENGFSVLIDNDYAIYQNFGTDRLPARPFFGECNELNEILNAIMAKHIKDIFN